MRLHSFTWGRKRVRFWKGFTRVPTGTKWTKSRNPLRQVNALVVGCSPELDCRLRSCLVTRKVQKVGCRVIAAEDQNRRGLICHWRRDESQNVWKKQWTVETGHGTTDNFTGQVMKKKNCSKTFIRNLFSGGSLSTVIYSVYSCYRTS